MKQQIIIYSNFFFVKTLLKTASKIVSNMNKKQKELIDEAEDQDVKDKIKEGLQALALLQQYAAEKAKNIHQAKASKK